MNEGTMTRNGNETWYQVESFVLSGRLNLEPIVTHHLPLADFEKGFIKAEVVSYRDLTTLGSVAAAREAGKYRLEGKDYVFADGDVALFRFNN